MEFGIFVQGHLPQHEQEADPAGAEHARIMHDVRVAQAADRSNWKYLWATEHHFLEEYSHLSANEVFLAYMAGVTERIHIGSGIFNITPPVNHPARVAERVAMLDHLSGGRFEFGTGRGSSTTEQQGFGISDPDSTRDMWAETMPEIVKMWREDDYAFDGEFFTMPSRNVLPKPWVKPHPPLWVAAGNPGTFEKAARMGLGVLCFAHGTPDKLAPLIEIYKKNIEKAEPVGDYVNNNVAAVSTMVCLEDSEKAKNLATNMGASYLQSLVFRYLDTFPKPSWVPDWPEVVPEPTREQVDAAVENGLFIAGDPDECTRGVQKYVDIGADQLILSPSGTQLPFETAVATTELFGKEVIPQFDTDPEHRTSRFRAAAAG